MSGRNRVLVAGLVAASIAFAGSSLGRLGPRRLEPSAPANDASGAWFCPHGGGEGTRSWVVLANPSRDEADVRVTTYAAGPPTRTTIGMLPGTAQFVEVPSPAMAAGTLLEYFGGTVAAGSFTARGEGGAAAEPCAPRAGRRWHVADGTSVRGHQAWLVAFNPFAVDAAFDVVLAAGDRTIRPGALRGVVLPPERATAIDLNRFALGEQTLAASVDVLLGKVAVAGIGVGERGLRASLGVPGAGRDWVLPGAGDDGPTSLAVLAPHAQEVPFRTRIQGAETQVDAIEDASVPGSSAGTFEVSAPQAGLVLTAEGPQPFVAARRTALSTVADEASTSGARGGSRLWVSLPALGPEGGQSFLVLQNPAERPATARVTLLTVGGPAPLPNGDAIPVPAGRTRVIDLSSATGGQPAAALVDAAPGTLVAAQASISSGGYAVAMGVRLEAP